MHILTCSEKELLTFEIQTAYQGHPIRIKPILDAPKIIVLVSWNDVMYTGNETGLKRELHVLFQMYSGFEVDLGIVTQEMAEDAEYMEHFVKHRIIEIADFLKSVYFRTIN